MGSESKVLSHGDQARLGEFSGISQEAPTLEVIDGSICGDTDELESRGQHKFESDKGGSSPGVFIYTCSVQSRGR